MIKYTLTADTREDAHSSMNKYLWSVSATKKHKLARELLSVLMWIPAGAALALTYLETSILNVVVVNIALFSLYFYSKLLKKLDKYFYKKWKINNAQGTLECEVNFDDDRFQINADNVQTIVPWSSVKKIRTEKNYIFIHISEDYAFIFPREQLDKNEEFGNLIKIAEKCT